MSSRIRQVSCLRSCVAVTLSLFAIEQAMAYDALSAEDIQSSQRKQSAATKPDEKDKDATNFVFLGEEDKMWLDSRHMHIQHAREYAVSYSKELAQKNGVFVLLAKERAKAEKAAGKSDSAKDKQTGSSNGKGKDDKDAKDKKDKPKRSWFSFRKPEAETAKPAEAAKPDSKDSKAPAPAKDKEAEVVTVTDLRRAMKDMAAYPAISQQVQSLSRLLRVSHVLCSCRVTWSC